ncbi:MAG: glycosyltransferase family 39 protein, partial [Anaerolineales bacterium]|nr:glycosyltransferase family 39 protein [Anaerolineales bacterium]
AAGFVLLLHAVGMLLMHYLPGPVPQALVLAWGVGVVIFPVGLEIRLTRTQENTDEKILRHRGVEAQREEEQSVKSVKSVVPILLLIAFILLLRLPNMGYKELQGDEGIILTRAAAALAGDDEVLFLHQKGPVEIVLPMLVWGGTGTIDEFWARWPFLWANVLAVLALAALAQRWFGSKVGWMAGVMLAVNGFTIAFARIIQYQSFVLLWGLLALLHADRYREDRNAWDLGLAAVFLAGSLLSHYDAVLVVPAVLWLIWPHLQISRWRKWLPIGTVGLVLLMLFYVPFVRHPNFAKTQSYLLGARLGQEPSEAVVRWSGAEVWQMVTFYNSSYYIIGLFVGLLVGLLVLRQEKNGRIAALLMFLVPLLFYTIIVDDARTHVYTIFPGATLLA